MDNFMCILLFGGLRSGSGWSGTSGIKELLLFINLLCALFAPCALFVFPVPILVPLGILCVTSKGWFIA